MRHAFMFALLLGLCTAAQSKSDIDVDVLQTVISRKQKELRDLAISHTVLKELPDGVDDSTYIFVRDVLSSLLSGGNRDAIHRSLVKSFVRFASYTLEKQDKAALDGSKSDALKILENLVESAPVLKARYEQLTEAQTRVDLTKLTPDQIKAQIKEAISSYDYAKMVGSLPSAWAIIKEKEPWKSEAPEATWVIDQIVASLVYDADSAKYSLDIPNLLDKFQAHYSGMCNKFWEPVISVGINYGNVFDDTSSYGFASEKIGMKFKLPCLNWKYKRAQGLGSGKPFRDDWRTATLNDIHLLAFASGLLYNITPLPNRPSPKNLFVGAGVGASFVNGLDFNVYYANPLPQSNDHLIKSVFTSKAAFVGCSFDLQIGDYLGALANTAIDK